MMSGPPGSGSKKPGDKSEGQLSAGTAGPGATFDPTAPPDEHPSDKDTRPTPRAAPAPGVPVSDTQSKRMKRKAAGVCQRREHLGHVGWIVVLLGRAQQEAQPW